MGPFSLDPVPTHGAAPTVVTCTASLSRGRTENTKTIPYRVYGSELWTSVTYRLKWKLQRHVFARFLANRFHITVQEAQTTPTLEKYEASNCCIYKRLSKTRKQETRIISKSAAPPNKIRGIISLLPKKSIYPASLAAQPCELFLR